MKRFVVTKAVVVVTDFDGDATKTKDLPAVVVIVTAAVADTARSLRNIFRFIFDRRFGGSDDSNELPVDDLPKVFAANTGFVFNNNRNWIIQIKTTTSTNRTLYQLL
jgi:hypothetical protein